MKHEEILKWEQLHRVNGSAFLSGRSNVVIDFDSVGTAAEVD